MTTEGNCSTFSGFSDFESFNSKDIRNKRAQRYQNTFLKTKERVPIISGVIKSGQCNRQTTGSVEEPVQETCGHITARCHKYWPPLFKTTQFLTLTLCVWLDLTGPISDGRWWGKKGSSSLSHLLCFLLCLPHCHRIGSLSATAAAAH